MRKKEGYCRKDLFGSIKYYDDYYFLKGSVIMNNRKTGGTGLAILLTVGIMVFIGFYIDSSKPKCAMGDCNRERTADSQYYVLHDLSYRCYGNLDYHAVYEQSQEKRKSKTNDSASDTRIKNCNSSQSSSNIDNKRTHTGKSYDPYDVGEYDDSDDFADEWAEEFGDGDYDDVYDDAYDY